MSNNLNAIIREWAKANGIEVPKNGNVSPELTMAYAKAQNSAPAEKPVKEKKAKKEKAETPVTNSDGKELHREFGEIFSAAAINHVIGQYPNRAREILLTGQDFMDNGMRSRYAAIRKAIAGEPVKRKAETAAETPNKGKAGTGKGKGKAVAENAAETRYMVILPTGATVTLASKAEAEKVAAIVPGAILGTL